MATKLGWQKEREAKQKQKEWEAQQNFEHQDWQQKRHDMIKKKEAAELQAKESEEKAPEFLKKLGTMKEKAQNKPKPKDEGPTIEELDDGTDIPPWHRPNAPEKPEWVVLLLMAAEKEAQEEEDDENVIVASGSGGASDNSLKFDYLPGKDKDNDPAGGDDQPEWMKQARNLKSTSNLESKTTKLRRSSSFNASEHSKTQPWMNATLKVSPKPTQSTGQGPAGGGLSASATAAIPPSTPLRPTKKLGASKSASADLVMSEDEKPEWMIGAEKLRKKKSAGSITTDPAAESTSTSKQKSDPPQPEWMRQRSKIKQKAPSSPIKAAASPESPKSTAPSTTTATPSTTTAPASPAPVARSQSPKSSKKEPAQPEWMRQRSKIKQKAPSSPKKLPTSPESPKKPAADASDQQPAWMVQRSKIKQKAEVSSPSPEKPTIATTNKPTKTDTNKASTAGNDNGEDEKDDRPAFMKHILKPRISIQELKESKVQEKLGSKEPMRQPSIRLTKEELTTNKVKEKLAQRPSLLDKKAQVKPEEMEWMKKKLRPRSSITAADSETVRSSSKPKSPAKDGDDDGKPAWMKQRDKLKPRVSPEELQTSKVQEKLLSKEPMRQSSIRLTKEELTANKVQEKLKGKEPMRQSSLRHISKQELASNPVKEKLAQRPSSLLDKKPPAQAQEIKEARSSLKPSGSSRDLIPKSSPEEKLAKLPSSVLDKKPPAAQAQEMKEGRASLKPSGSARDLIPKPSSEETADAGPEWMKEAHRRMSSVRALDAADISSSGVEADKPPVRKMSGGKKVPPEQADDKEKPDKRPEFMKEAQRRRSSRGGLSLSDNEADEKEQGAPPKMRRSKTANEKYPTEKYPEKKKPWWMREAEKRLSAKGIITLDDKAQKELKRLHQSGKDAGKDAVPAREIKKVVPSSDTKTDTVAKEWEGISPADIMTPRKSDGTIDKKTDKEVPIEWWKVGPPDNNRRGSFSIMDDLDALSSESKGSKPASAQEPPGEARFWSSLVSLGNEAFEGGSDNSTDSDDDGDKEKPPRKPDFTASMNDISAAMRADTTPARESILGSNSLLALPPRESILGGNSMLSTTKSRSQSGSIGKRKKDKDKEKKSKKDKKKKDKKKEEKKEKKKKKEKKEEAKA